MRLTDVKIRQTNPTSKMQRLADGNGLYLVITPKGNKVWHFRYYFEGKPKTLSLGKYPDVGLKDARDKLHEACKKVAAGGDPSAERKVKKAEEKNPFRKVALEWWHAEQSQKK